MLFQSQYEDIVYRLPWIRTHRKKQEMRTLDGQKRRIMQPERVKAESHAIIEQIERMQCFKEAKTVMVYYPIHNEVDLRHLVHLYQDEKTFLLPATISSKKMEIRVWHKDTPLLKGRFGIPEPNTPAWTGPVDLILVPGVAFDKECHRLGRGGGYYDRFLKHYRHATKVGVCYEFQLHHHVPCGYFDMPVDRVVTPKETIEAQSDDSAHA